MPHAVVLLHDWVAHELGHLEPALESRGEVSWMAKAFHGYTAFDCQRPDVPELVGPWTVWHNDAVQAAPSSSVAGSLAHADLAFRTGRAWGIQPHIEVTADIFERMCLSLRATAAESGPVVDAIRSDASANERRAQTLLDWILADLLES